jgi:RHS repeat-associated protein
MKNRLFLTFLLCLALAVSAQAYSPEYDQNGRLNFLKADLNRDGYFNIVDFGLVASAWLDERCGLSNSCEGADIFPEGGDGAIDFRDLSLSAAPYGLCTDPTNPDCIHVPLTLFEPPTDDVLHSIVTNTPVDEGADGGEGGWPDPDGTYATGRRYRALVPAGGHLGVSLVIPRPGGGWVSGKHRQVVNVTAGADYIAEEVDYSPATRLAGNGEPRAKPLLPSLPGSGGPPIVMLFDDGEHGDGMANDGWYGTSGGFGTYGDQGAQPLLPSFPGGGPITTLLVGEKIMIQHPTFYFPAGGGVSGYVGSGGRYSDFISATPSTSGNQGAKPLVPISLTVYDGLGHQDSDSVTITGNDTTGPVLTMIGPGGGGSGFPILCEPDPDVGSLGDVRITVLMALMETQGAKPLLPSLPGGGGPESGDSWGTVDYLDMNGDGFPDLIPEKGSASKLHPFSGEFCESAVDMRIPGRGPDFVWGRTYRSRVGPNTVIGNGWDHSYNIYLEQYGANLILHNDSGRRDIFYPQPNGTWTSKGFFREFIHEPGSFLTLTFSDGGVWRFRSLSEEIAPGKISAITDRNGNSLTFDYDSSGRLITVHDTLDTSENSREIAIAYNSSGHIESVTDWTGRQVKYQYYSIGDPNGSVGDLKSVTTPAIEDTPTGNDFPEGKTTTYTYSRGFADERLNHNLLTITDPKGQTYLRNIYSTDPAELSSDHVTQQTWGDSNTVIHFTYIQEEPEPNNNYAVTRVIVNDWGNVTEYSYDNLNRLVILRQYTGRAEPNLPTSVDPNVNMPMEKLRSDDPPFFETRFQYNKDFLPTRTDYPNGNYVKKVYESDVNPGASARSRANLRETNYFAGSLETVSDQNEITRLFVYDANINNNTNQVTCYVGPRGYETLYDYDPNGNRIRTEYVRPAEPNIIYEWQYNEHGQLTASIGADNGSGHRRRDEYTYYTEEDPYQNGYLKNIVVDSNNLALTTAYEYDDVGNVVRMTDPRGHDTQFVVNELNQVVRSISREVTEGSGVRHQRDTYYDENDNIVQVDVQNKDDQGVLQTNENFTTTCEYDILNYPTSVEAEVDTTKAVRTEFEYNGKHNLTLIRSGEATNGSEPNNVIRYLYDERGLVFQTTRAPGDPNNSTTQYDYDGNGNLKKVSQGLGSPPRISSFEYDGFNRLVEVNDPMGNVSEYHYDAGGNLISKRFEGELVDMPSGADNVRLYESSYEYDALNRLIHAELSHFDPDTQEPIGDGNSITHFFYNDNSQLTRVVDDNGNETHYDYDTASRLNLVTDAKDNTTAYSYDENSNITALTAVEKSDLDEPNEIFVTTYQYDNLDRLTRVTDNNDNTRYGYDSRGNCTRITNALENESRYEYDGLNRLIRTVRDMDGDGADPGDANDIVTSQSWDDNSRLVTQTDDNGNTTAYDYDALNRRTKITYADGTENQFAYDVHHNIVQTTDAAGTVVNSTYDLLNRLTAKTITPGLGVSDNTTFENYKYDGLSRVVWAEDDDSLVTRSLDSLSNVIIETLNGQTTTSVHDDLGNKLSCTYPGGRGITCTYDELSRKKVIAADGTAVSTYSYIGPGRVRRCEYGNNTKCEYTYDNIKRITSTKHSDSAGGIIDQRSYRWDNMYNKTQRKDIRTGGPQLTHDYTYDAIDRLIQTTVSDAVAVVRETDYSLDGVGNRTTVTGSPNPGNYTMDETTPEPADFQMNQYTTTPFDSRSYDKNGNLVTIDDGQRTQKDIRYDYRNQMVEFTETSTGQVHTYSYDVLGRRTERVVDSTGSAQTTRYLYDGFQVIEEQDDAGDTLATYVYGHYIDEVLNMQRGSEVYYYHTDDLFNVMAVTDAIGAVVERYEYQDYGEPSFFDGSGSTVTGSAIGNPYLYTGRRYDPETSLYYFRTRYLDPKAGRFTRSR